VYHQFLAPMLLSELQKQSRVLAGASRTDRAAPRAERRELAARIEALEARAASRTGR
jgi:hypothetical protein